MKYLKRMWEMNESNSTTIKLLEIPYETYGKDKNTGGLDKNKIISGKSKIISLVDRKIVVIDVNGIHIPFYVSTGHGGKKEVKEGKWYPFFGIGTDVWINKGSQSDINNYYNIPLLRKIAGQLDTKIGDIRDDDSYPKVKGTGQHMSFINKDFSPASYDDQDCFLKVYKNIEELKKKLYYENYSGIYYDKQLLPKLKDLVGSLHKIAPYVLEIGNKVQYGLNAKIEVYEDAKKVKVFNSVEDFLRGIRYPVREKTYVW
jgi:hypothetical protein